MRRRQRASVAWISSSRNPRVSTPLRHSISADTAMRLARYFGTTPEFWMNLQTAYDITREETVRRDQIEAITPRNVA